MAKSHWYMVEGRNCLTSSRTTCGAWSPSTADFFLSAPPSFTSNAYAASVAEDATVGTVVTTVTATDTDTGDSVSYSITGGNGAGKFGIDGGTGAITVRGGLDHATTPSYTLTVEAEDTHGATDTAAVTVSVTNVNLVSIAGSNTVMEGKDLTFAVTAESGGITVVYSFSGTAIKGNDYTDPELGTVQIPAGQTTVNIVLPTTSDGIDEPYETVEVTITGVIGSGAKPDPANNSATGTIADLITISSIGDDKSAPAVEVDIPTVAGSPQAMSTLWFKLDTDEHRAYTLELEARTAGGTWRPATATSVKTKTGDTNQYTSTLPGYEDLGLGQVVWVEGASTPDDRYALLEVSLPSGVSAPAKYRLSISKPDFAIVEPPVLSIPAAGATTGNIGVTLTVRNSTTKGSPDRKGAPRETDYISLDCEVTTAQGRFWYRDRNHPFLYLRDGRKHFVDKESEQRIDLGTICQGAGLDQSPSRDQLHAVRITLNVVDGLSHEAEAILVSTNWPFNPTGTLWDQQTKTMGGIQIFIDNLAPHYDGRCTSSFTIDLKPNSAATKLVHGSSPFDAMTTTGHCTEPGAKWYQGSRPYSSPQSSSNLTEVGTDPIMPQNTTCGFEKRLLGFGPARLEKITDCRIGDHSYVEEPARSSSDFDDGLIFKPMSESPSTHDAMKSPRIEYFSGHGGVRFEIVSARPPDLGDKFHKVGITTGWSSGRMITEGSQDDTCPGNVVGDTDNWVGKNDRDEDEFIECLVNAGFTSVPGDSGSPVFVVADDPSTGNVEVILVGVVYGRKHPDSTGVFIPIERVYAESLRQGYDWETGELRPVPVLDESSEHITLVGDGPVIRATFNKGDFSPGPGLFYQAVLFRTVGGATSTVTNTSGDILAREMSKDTSEDKPGPVAEFDGGLIPVDQRSGIFSVRVRLCAYDISEKASEREYHCGAYGSAGIASVEPPAVPQNFKTTGSSTSTIELSWDKVTGANAYELDYRVQGAAEWSSFEGSVTSPPTTITGLSCATNYEFIVRASGDGSTYPNNQWGFWSAVVTASTAACPVGSASVQAQTESYDSGDHATLEWPADPGVDRYLIEVPAIGYYATVAGGTTEHRIPASLLAGLRGDRNARVWSCTASVPGLCELHWETHLPVASALPLPPAPETLSATASGETSVGLSWDSMSGVEGYHVEYRPSEADEWEAVDEAVSTASWTVSDLSCGTAYEFRVSALGDGTTYNAVRGPPSDTAAATTQACNESPAFDSEVYAFSIPEDSALNAVVGTVSATDPDGDSLSFSILSGNEDGSFALSADATSTQVVVAAALDHETTAEYSLVVEARDDAGGAAATTVAITVTDIAEGHPPPAPQNLTATSTAHSVTLTWDAPDDPTVTGYQILRRKPAEPPLKVHVEDTGSTDTTYVDTANVAPDTTYVYRVKAINAHGVGEWSMFVQITTGSSQ